MSSANSNTLVVVTGASGFIGSHVVRELLQRGYRVRATVRNPDDEAKTAHLKKMAEELEGDLELTAGELLDPGSFDEAVADADYVQHVAAVTRLAAKNPQREIVDPAVEGMKNVFGAAARSKRVRRVVLTSSAAAIHDTSKPSGHVFNEKDWNDWSTLKHGPYLYAKTLAEREAWKLHESLDEDQRFELVAVNPVVVFGPVYTRAQIRSSPEMVRALLKRNFPACPNLYFSVVDVRDVAAAHVEAMVRPEAGGRYLLSNGGMWFRQMAAVLKPRFPQYRIPTGRLPDFVMYLAALFDKRLTWTYLRENLGKVAHFDTTRAERELGLKWTAHEKMLADTAQSFVDGGFV